MVAVSTEVILWSVVALWLGLIALAASQMRKLWTQADRVEVWSGVPGWWLWGAALWRAAIRSGPVALIAATLLAMTMAFLLATGGHRATRETYGQLETRIFVLLALITLFLFCLVGSITLMNRPRLFVPRNLRSQPGAIAEWSRDIKRWHRRVEGRPTALKPLLFVLFVVTGQIVGAARPRGRVSDDRPHN